MKKRILCLLLAAVLVFGLSANALAADVKYQKVKGDYTYCPSLGFLDFVGNQTYSFEYTDAYFSHSGYQYDHGLANASMVLTQAAFASATSSSEGWDTANSNFNALMRQCGFGNLAANADAVSHPGGETLGAYAASKQLLDNGGNYTLITLAIRGHNYGGEWYSNFDVGREGEDHAGFVDARDKALSFLKQYIADQKITGRVKVWITGFSRGAITANLVGGCLDQGFDLGANVSFSPHDLFCYTFETPQGIADPHAKDPLYDNIYNIMNPNDFVPYASFSEWGQYRYGQDLYTPCRQYDADYESRKAAMTAELDKMGWMNVLGILKIDWIDNFVFYDLNPATSGLNADEITQIEFYDMLVEAMMRDLAPSRDYFVDNLQADIQELSKDLLGIDTGRLMNALGIFAGKFTSPANLARILNSLTPLGIITDHTIVGVVMDMFMDSLIEAECADYNGDQVRAQLANLVPKMLSFTGRNPSIVVTLLQNVFVIINAHFSEVTHAWLRTTEASYFEKQARPLAYTGGYGDVSRSDWFANEVEYVTRGGLMNGMDYGVFAPDRNTTRAEFATVLYRLEGSPATNLYDPFTDVIKGSWYQQAVAWAYQNGVVNGMTETTFEPDSTITREQMVTMLYRYANRVAPTSVKSPLTAFSDYIYVSDWAVAPLQWAVGVGVINGMEDGTLRPQSFTTRAQIARVLQQFCEIKPDVV